MNFNKIISLNTARLAVVLVALLGSQLAKAEVLGLWKTEPGDTGGYLLVEIKPCEDRLCGEIVGAFDKDNVELAEYEHNGKRMIWGMKEDGQNKWRSGKIWAPDRDKTYSSWMQLNGDKLKVSGCVMGGLICRSQSWQRPESG